MYAKLKQWLRKTLFKSWLLKKTAILFLEGLSNFLAKLKKMSFPRKYNWEMKLKMLSGLYEKETVALCKKVIRPGMRIIDVGAHIGYYSRLFAKLVGPKGMVFAFEPEPGNFELLQRNTRFNENIKALPKAVSERDGRVDFYKSPGKSGCHSLVKAEFRQEKITVEALSLDSFVSGLDSPKIDLIKMDVEGGEPYVLNGAKELLHSNKNIMLLSEFSPENLSLSGFNPRNFLEDLSGFGFNIYLIKERGQLELLKPGDWEVIQSFIQEKKKSPQGGEETYINLFCQK